jgi:glycerophosphoryl diester phosphodiesterase
LKPGSRYAQGFPDQLAVDGTRIPRLSELFDLVKSKGNTTVRFNIETKISPLKPEETLGPEAFARAVIAEIRKAGMASRTTLQSFDWRTLRIAQRDAPEIKTVYLSAQQSWLDNIQAGKPAPSPWTAGFDVHQKGGSVPHLVKAAGGGIWSPFFGDLTAANVTEAHALGLLIIPWTVNREEDMARVMALGVNGLITDRPDIARRVMAARGLVLPDAGKP